MAINSNVHNDVASIVLAAGKGSRMTGYKSNKTLLPLIPSGTPYLGQRPILHEVLENLPDGPKAIVVHHCGEAVKQATQGFGVTYIEQPITNGTGGALLACKAFLQSVSSSSVVITMGDVPLIRRPVYDQLIRQLDQNDLVVLAFDPEDKAQYGLLEMEGNRVKRIVEWKYWRNYNKKRRASLQYCNAGVYAANRVILLHYLDRLERRPHTVEKERNGHWVTIKEYFLTDLVELMAADNKPVGMILAPCDDVMGVDTPQALVQVQKRYQQRLRHGH